MMDVIRASSVENIFNVGPTSVWDLVASPECCCGWPALMKTGTQMPQMWTGMPCETGQSMPF